METSTPVRNTARDSLRRRSLLSSAFVGGNKNSPNRSVCIEEPDAEEERSQRRSMVAMRQRLSTVSTSSPFGDGNLLREEDAMRAHLQTCLKLYADNKITLKNAWDLRIIDIIKKIATNDSDGGDALKVGTASLDIGTKVYCYRVDDVYERVMKLASALSRQEITNKNEGGENAPGDDEGLPKKRGATKKKKKVLLGDKRLVLVKDKKQLFAPIKKIEPSVFGTKENIDAGATDNLFTFKLRSDNSTHHLMLMSDKKRWNDEPDLLCGMSDVKVQIDKLSIQTYTPCQSFNNFEIGNWDPTQEKQQLAAEVDPVVVDEQGIPVVELDGSIHDIFQDDDCAADDEENEPEEHLQAQMFGGIAPILERVPEDHLIATDYGFNSIITTASGQQIYKMWAGPSHWKIKYNKRASVRYSGTVEHQAPKPMRKAKESGIIDFDLEPDMSLLTTPMKPISRKMPKSCSKEKITLPEVNDYIEEIRKVRYYFSKPTWLRMAKTSSVSNPDHDDDVQPYNYENPNDSQYCSQHSMDNDGSDGGTILREEEVPGAAHGNLLKDNLVDEPMMVPQNQITYALHAKTMDMKRLKDAVWECLTDGAPKEVRSSSQVKSLKFSELYNKLPSRITADMNKNLSCHLAFAALLHLCNEYNLVLDQEGNDFMIAPFES